MNPGHTKNICTQDICPPRTKTGPALVAAIRHKGHQLLAYTHRRYHHRLYSVSNLHLTILGESTRRQ